MTEHNLSTVQRIVNRYKVNTDQRKHPVYISVPESNYPDKEAVQDAINKTKEAIHKLQVPLNIEFECEWNKSGDSKRRYSKIRDCEVIIIVGECTNDGVCLSELYVAYILGLTILRFVDGRFYFMYQEEIEEALPKELKGEEHGGESI